MKSNFKQGINVSGNVEVVDGLVVSKDVVLGEDSSSTISLNGQINTTLVPTAAVDLGTFFQPFRSGIINFISVINNIDMNNSFLQNVADPVDPTDGTNRQWVETYLDQLNIDFTELVSFDTATKFGWYYTPTIENITGAPTGATGFYIFRRDGDNHLTLHEVSTAADARIYHTSVLNVNDVPSPSSWKQFWHTGNLIKTTEQLDTTIGNMVQVGDYGMGAIVATTESDCNTGLYIQAGAVFVTPSTLTNGPSLQGPYFVKVTSQGSTGCVQHFVHRDTGTVFQRTWEDGNVANATDWLRFYTNADDASTLDAQQATSTVKVMSPATTLDLVKVFGIGNVSGAPSIADPDDQSVATGFYIASRAAFTTPPFDSGDCYLDHKRAGNDNAKQVAYSLGNVDEIATRSTNDAGVTWTVWKYLIHTGNDGQIAYKDQENTFAENTQFSKNVTISGDLFVEGTTQTVDQINISTSQALVTLNNGELGAGVTAGFSGVTIDRGTLPDYQFGFDEVDGAFSLGEVGDLQPVATRELNPINDGVARWNSTTNRFETAIITDVLPNVANNVGTFGNSITIPVITVDDKGRVTVVTTSTVRSASTSQTGVVQLNNTVTSTSTTQAATANAVKLANDNANSKVDPSLVLTAGNGLTGGGNLSANRTFTLGTPSTITQSSTNSVTSTSHTHAIDTATSSVRGIVQLADNPKALAGTNTTDAMTAQLVHAAFNQYGLGASGNVYNFSSGSLNTLTATGLYAIGAATVTEKPSEANASLAASLLVIRTGVSDRVIQVYYHTGTGSALNKTWQRTFDGTVWSTWDEYKKQSDVVANNIDSVVGKIMTVGYAGIGSIAITSDNWDTITQTGFYVNTLTTAVGIPESYTNLTMIHIERDAGSSTQIAFRNNISIPQIWRRQRSGSWGAWVEVLHSGNTGTATTFDVTTSVTDTTANRLTKVGDGGLLSTEISNISNLETANPPTGFYRFRNDITGRPPMSGTNTLWHNCFIEQGLSNRVTIESILVTGGVPRKFIGERQATSGAFTWTELSSADNVALPLVAANVGTFGNNITIPVVTIDAEGRTTAVTATAIRTSSTSQTGLVRLNNSTTSTLTTEAATANAVKLANDNANTRVLRSGDTMTGLLSINNSNYDSHLSIVRGTREVRITPTTNGTPTGSGALRFLTTNVAEIEFDSVVTSKAGYRTDAGKNHHTDSVPASFGGDGAANSIFEIAYNSSSESLDFNFVG